MASRWPRHRSSSTKNNGTPLRCSGELCSSAASVRNSPIRRTRKKSCHESRDRSRPVVGGAPPIEFSLWPTTNAICQETLERRQLGRSLEPATPRSINSQGPRRRSWRPHMASVRRLFGSSGRHWKSEVNRSVRVSPSRRSGHSVAQSGHRAEPSWSRTIQSPKPQGAGQIYGVRLRYLGCLEQPSW